MVQRILVWYLFLYENEHSHSADHTAGLQINYHIPHDMDAGVLECSA
jgi:hypothetical protein